MKCILVAAMRGCGSSERRANFIAKKRGTPGPCTIDANWRTCGRAFFKEVFHSRGHAPKIRRRANNDRIGKRKSVEHGCTSYQACVGRFSGSWLFNRVIVDFDTIYHGSRNLSNTCSDLVS